MEYIVDTNILVYETIEDSEYHNDVVSKLDKLENVYVPSIVLLELSIVLKRLGLNKELIYGRLKEIIDDDRYIILDYLASDLTSAIEILIDEKEDIRSLVDKSLLAIALRRDMGIYTYDKALIKQCRRMGIPILKY